MKEYEGRQPRKLQRYAETQLDRPVGCETQKTSR